MSNDSLGYVIDDSSLFHGTYDPVKAREYYLRTRKLKGRQKGSQSSVGVRKPAKRSSQALGGKPNRAKTKSRQAELRAQAEALRKRLEHLREVLADLVEAAQKRSGGDPNKNEKDKAPESKADKADRNKAEKKSKPETASEKKERAKKAKEEYEKEHPTSLSQDVDILKAQVEDIQAKIKKALANARDRNKAGVKNEESGSKNKQLDGP